MKKIKSNNRKFNLDHLVSLYYFDKLYKLKTFPEQGDINLTDDSMYEKSNTMDRVKDFYGKKFINKLTLFTGRDFVQKEFDINDLRGVEPRLLILFPMKNIKIKYEWDTHKERYRLFFSKRLFSIKMKWEISKDLKKIVDFCYYKDDRKYSINKNEVNLLDNESFQGKINVIIRWKGDKRILSNNKNIYLKQILLKSNISKDLEKIENIKKEITQLKRKIERSTKLDKKIKYAFNIFEKNRTLESMYTNDFFISSQEKAKSLDNQIKYYKLYIKLLKEKLGKDQVPFNLYLKLNNLLYIKYEKEIDRIIQTLKERPTSNPYVRTRISEINEMISNIKDAERSVEETIKTFQDEKNNRKLYYYFEILGNLNIHLGLLRLISNEYHEDPSIYFEFDHALESYQKALEYLNQISIPGTAYGSIRADYMEIFNSFMINVDGLKNKMSYLQKVLRKESEETLEKQLVVFDTPNQRFFLGGNFRIKFGEVETFLNQHKTNKTNRLKLAFVNEEIFGDLKSGLTYLENEAGWFLNYMIKGDKREDIDERLISFMGLTNKVLSDGWGTICLISRDKHLIHTIATNFDYKIFYVLVEPSDVSLNGIPFLQPYTTDHDLDITIYKAK